MRLYDTHCHLQDARLAPDIDPVMRRAGEAGVCRMLCCASEEADWPAVSRLSLRFPCIRPAYGLHPWYLDRRPAGWEALLRNRLLAEPESVIGEIGLDHALDAPDRALQKDILCSHLRIAAELDRPVSLHCRKAWGALLALLKTLPRLPPALIFHAFSGDAELIPELARLNGWFSFGGSLTREGNRRGRAAASQVPADRLLLESDAPDLAPRQAPPLRPNEPAYLVHTLAELALCRWQSLETLAELTWQNSCRAFKEKVS
jgi:TatD DNase family protein